MDRAVIEYRKRRQKRLDRRMRKDDEEETNQPNNKKKSGGHGNTRLPFGLCQRHGIEVGKDWTPRDAWNALEEKGVKPSDVYSKMAGRTYDVGYGYYKDVGGVKDEFGYRIEGEYVSPKKDEWARSRSTVTRCRTKEEMYSCLKRAGVKSFKDPDTGEKVDPSKMDVPDIVLDYKDHHFKDVYFGLKPKFAVLYGKDFAGDKYVIAQSRYFGDVKKAAEKHGLGSVRISKDLQKQIDRGYIKP